MLNHIGLLVFLLKSFIDLFAYTPPHKTTATTKTADGLHLKHIFRKNKNKTQTSDKDRLNLIF